MTALFFNKNKR